MALPKRLMSKLQVDMATGCWLWLGGLTKDGYGKAWWNGSMRAHRLVWMMLRGPIPDDLKLLHTCDRPRCCNPQHLFVGTQLENVKDMDAKGRRRSPRGKDHWASRLSENDVRTIRALYASGKGTQAQLGAQYGLSKASVGDIVRRRTWKATL